ncbi:hypothetical protein [Sphingobacterium mizutaii]|uniref:hypothetical protein n=1 Tax=Sphingobacterium mizutaii TaxID=1010 RepID=UPI001625914B|nr:hypothetical protein [Sphingobacterium mizutaii]
MDLVGIQLFLKKFPKQENKIEIPDNKYSLYDLLIKGEKHDKYIELKCISEILTYSLTTLITVSDFDFLVKEVPTGDSSLYVLFDDHCTVVYDLKAVYHLNLYSIEKKKNFSSEMNKTKYEESDYIVIDYAECLKAGVVKCYGKEGSKGLADFKISELLKHLKNNTATEEYIENIISKLN